MSTENKAYSIELHDVDINALRNLLGRSLLCDSKLGFEISPTGTISSIAGGSSFFKSWEENIETVCAKFESNCLTSAKIFIFDGSKFCNRVLSMFGSKANIRIFCDKTPDGFTAQKIVVDNGALTIRTICSLLRLGFVELTSDEYKSIFENTTNLRKLKLTSNQFKTLSNFGSLNMLGKLVEGIELKTTQKGLVASDGSFDFVLDDKYQYDLKPISLHKALLKFIDDNEEYDVSIATTVSGRDVMTLKSTTHNLIMTMALMVDTALDINAINTEDEDDLPF